MDEIRVEGYGCTNIGHDRLINEDHYDMTDSLFILADGMGGHNAGEIASNIAVKNIIDIIGKYDPEAYDKHTDKTKIQKIITQAISKTNEAIISRSSENIEYKGMGTTIVLALLQKQDTIHIANVGDSRAYLYRMGKLELLTEDHTITANMLRDGTITPSEVKNHPYRHYLSQSLGTSKNIKPFSSFFHILQNDIILLCSDGLWNALKEHEITKILKQQTTSKKICIDLINHALDHNSQDNITCIILKVKKENRS